MFGKMFILQGVFRYLHVPTEAGKYLNSPGMHNLKLSVNTDYRRFKKPSKISKDFEMIILFASYTEKSCFLI